MARLSCYAMAPAAVLAMFLTAARAAQDGLILSGARAVHEDVLAVVPRDAVEVVVFRHLDQLNAKVQQLGRLVQAPIPDLLEQFKAASGLKDGLDAAGSAAILVMPGAEAGAAPVPVLLLPVTDYGKLVEQLKPEKPDGKIVEVQVMRGEFLMAQRGSYAVFAEQRHRAILEKVLAAKKNLAEDLTSLKPWLAENDIASVTTAPGIKLFVAAAQKQLAAVKAVLGGMGKQGAQAMAAFVVYDQILAAADKEVRLLAVGARISRQGEIRVRSRVQFLSGGEAARSLATVEPPTANLLSGLPDEPFVMALGSVVPKAMFDFSFDLMKKMPKLYGLSDEQIDKLAEASRDSVRQLRQFSVILGVGKPGAPLYSHMLMSFQADDAREYLVDYQKFAQQSNKIVGETTGTLLPKVEVKKIEVDDKPALQLTMTMPSAGTQAIPNYAALMEKMFGPGGRMVAYIVAADAHTVLLGYTDQELLRKALKDVGQPAAQLAAQPAVSKTLAALLPKAQVVACFSPQGCVSFVSQAMTTFLPPGLPLPKIPEFPRTPPIGLAAKAADGEVQVELLVPAAVIRAIGTYVTKVRQGTAVVPPPAQLESKPAEK